MWLDLILSPADPYSSVRSRMPYYDQIPTDADWADPVDVSKYFPGDVRYAETNFSGKSIDEVMQFFYDLVLSAQECVFYMPRRPFAYYVQAFVRYLREAAAHPDDGRFVDRSVGAGSFLNMIIFRLINSPQVICPVMDELLPVAHFVAENQTTYEASEHIFGSFNDLLEKIKSLCQKQCAGLIT
jgi:hypothetical protein